MSSILITGGTGFLGRHLVAQLLEAQDYERICVFSRSEHAQAALRAQFEDERLRFFIGDVRDLDRLERAFHGVDDVIHAAALKRIEVGHYNPEEMVKTNITGTANVIEACQRAGVKRAVFVSSDKAYQPISPYGQSKALGESMFLAANNTRGAYGPQFSVVRYGNVAGSTGSVIPRWRGKKKVQVTDPECTRFWMYVNHACEFVLAGLHDQPKLHIPKLPAFRLGDLAEAMGVEMEVIGLPPYEKKHESLDDGMSSEHAPRLGVAQLREMLKEVP